MKTYSKDLTQKEIKDIQKDFTKYLNSNKSIIINNNIDIENESCYISSQDIKGVYFPNINFILNSKMFEYSNFYNFLCIGKNSNGQNGLFLILKDEYIQKNICLNDITFEPFLYINEKYFQIKNDIKTDLENEQENINILKSFKVVTKKDGSDFKEFNHNFIFNAWGEKKPNIYFYNSYNNNELIEIKIILTSDLYICYYLTDEEKQLYKSSKDITTNFIYKLILKEIERTQKRIIKLNEQLKNSLKLFLKAEKLKNNYEAERQKIIKENSYFYDYMLIK